MKLKIGCVFVLMLVCANVNGIIYWNVSQMGRKKNEIKFRVGNDELSIYIRMAAEQQYHRK